MNNPVVKPARPVNGNANENTPPETPRPGRIQRDITFFGAPVVVGTALIVYGIIEDITAAKGLGGFMLGVTGIAAARLWWVTRPRDTATEHDTPDQENLAPSYA